MRTIGHFETISSVLFIVESSDPQLTPNFDFFLSELMMRLHKDVVKNIMFGFTHCRTSVPPFPIGTVGEPLIQLLVRKNLPTPGLKTNKNAFVFDAEGFLHAAAWQQNGLLMADNMDRVSESWSISAEKARLLVNATMNLPEHDTRKTLSLELFSRLIDGMLDIMVRIAQAISETTDDLNVRLKRIADLDIKALEVGKARFQHQTTSIVERKLSYLRMVCKGPGCASMRNDPATNSTMLFFEKSCVSPCPYSSNLWESVFGVPQLKEIGCFANEGANCNECGHSFMPHCAISFQQDYETKTITNEIEKAKFEGNAKDLNETTHWKLRLTEEKMKLECEEKLVGGAIAKMSLYQGANAVAAYNDGIVEHLQYLMDNAKSDGKTKEYDKYAAQKQAHEALIQRRQRDIWASNDQVPTETEIQMLLFELTEMEVYGNDIRELVNRREAQVPSRTRFQSKCPSMEVGRNLTAG